MLHGICAQLVEIQLLFHLLPSHTRLAGIAFNCAAKLYSVTSSSCWPRTVPCSDQGDMEPVSPVGLRLFVYAFPLVLFSKSLGLKLDCFKQSSFLRAFVSQNL